MIFEYLNNEVIIAAVISSLVAVIASGISLFISLYRIKIDKKNSRKNIYLKNLNDNEKLLISCLDEITQFKINSLSGTYRGEVENSSKLFKLNFSFIFYDNIFRKSKHSIIICDAEKKEVENLIIKYNIKLNNIDLIDIKDKIHILHLDFLNIVNIIEKLLVDELSYIGIEKNKLLSVKWKYVDFLINN